MIVEQQDFVEVNPDFIVWYNINEIIIRGAV